jgi:hypothetical protein
VGLPANWQPLTPPISPTRKATRIALPILFLALIAATWTLFQLLVGMKVVRPPALIFNNALSPEWKFFWLVAAPYLLSLLFLAAPNTYTRNFSCGIAGVTAAVLIYWEGLFFAVLLIALLFEGNSSMRGSDPPAGPIAILVFFALLCHGTVLLCSLVVCGLNIRGFPTAILGAILAGGYAGHVYSAQQAAQAKYVKSIEDIEQESNTAFTTVESISWCAIRYASLHGGREYPASLEAITGSPICLRKWSVTAVPHYTVIYAPTSTGFSVKATAPRNPLSDPRNAESNESGITLVEYQDPKYNAYPVEMRTGSPVGDILTIRNWLRNYSIDHKEAGYPRQLTDVSLVVDLFRQHGMSQFLAPNSIQYFKTLFNYEPAAAELSGKINSYKLRATCEDYGNTCLHSFLLTGDGHIFFTSADRPATPADTKLERCPRKNATTFCTPGD